jgi:hypothetical protein
MYTLAVPTTVVVSLLAGNLDHANHASVEIAGQFSGTANPGRGGAPPGPKNAKAADAANVHGPIENSSYAALCKNDAPTVSASESSDKSILDYRTFYDNARGNIDDAIKAVWGAARDGLLTFEDAGEIAEALRQRQAAIAQKPAGLGQITGKIGGTKSRLALGWPRRRPRRMPDREASRARMRMLGGSGALPSQIRGRYTEAERSVLTIVGTEHKQNGRCELAVDAIAAKAGVCRRMVQNAVSEAVRHGDLAREERLRPNGMNDTNVLRILSREWLAWLKRMPKQLVVWPDRESNQKVNTQGCKPFTATKTQGSNNYRFSKPNRQSRRANL